mgnify:CR=1 FL=1
MLILWLWTGLTELVHKALGLLLLLVGTGALYSVSLAQH